MPSESAKTYDSFRCRKYLCVTSGRSNKTKASFIRITLAYHVPDGANVPRAPSGPCVTFGTLGTWYIDLLCK